MSSFFCYFRLVQVYKMYWSGLINPHWPSTTQTPFENTILSSWQHTQGIQQITQIFELYYNACDWKMETSRCYRAATESKTHCRTIWLEYGLSGDPRIEWQNSLECFPLRDYSLIGRLYHIQRQSRLADIYQKYAGVLQTNWESYAEELPI